MRSQEFTGKTTQEAIDAGLAALGVTIADVHVDVIQEGAKGLFGLFGSKPACVRLTVMDDEKEDDHGLSDLLSSFSLNDQQPRKKQEKKAEKKPAEKKPEKQEEKKPEKPVSRPLAFLKGGVAMGALAGTLGSFLRNYQAAVNLVCGGLVGILLF